MSQLSELDQISKQANKAMTTPQRESFSLPDIGNGPDAIR